MSWSIVVSAILHVLFLTLVFYSARMLFTDAGAKEQMQRTTIVTIDRKPVPTPAPQPKRVAVRVHPRAAPPPPAPQHHELAKQAPHAPVQPPPPLHHPVVESRVAVDEAVYAKEVAQLNKGNDPHSIPTIDPADRASSSKSYAFNPGQSSDGQDNGNGIITPTRSWHDRGMDCYYGRYEYTYPDGAEEDGDIAWPFCYDPGADPFKGPPHLMPFPPPLPGYTLPAGTQLPPLEKQFYDQWVAGNGAGSAP